MAVKIWQLGQSTLVTGLVLALCFARTYLLQNMKFSFSMLGQSLKTLLHHRQTI
jgi:hypothetical protein